MADGVTSGEAEETLLRVSDGRIFYRWHFAESAANFQLTENHSAGQQCPANTILYLRNGLASLFQASCLHRQWKASLKLRQGGVGDDGVEGAGVGGNAWKGISRGEQRRGGSGPLGFSERRGNNTAISEVVYCVTATRVGLSMCHLTASASGCSHAVAGLSVVAETFLPLRATVLFFFLLFC